MKCADRIVGVTTTDRSNLIQAILLDKKPPPASCIRRSLCDCGSGERKLSGIEQVPEISNLAGLLIQTGAHPRAGTTFSLKWADFNKTSRVGEVKVYGGCGGKQHAGHWSAIDSCCSKVFVSCGRVWNYSYRFRFDEDWQRADIDIRFCCTPSGNTCCSYPSSCTAYDMVQTEDSKNGSQWDRRQSKNGGPMEQFYVLEAVYESDGSPTDHVASFKLAPKTMILSR
mmetsp:Transcript_26979/g.31873  ORF Transcript_26979/g.31873 Transcript_26979/m.31873 type:complete len:226 (-) Transcript_26979:940-1617(-)